MRIAIFGAGGVGGYFGGRLAAANRDVVFITRGDHLKAMRVNGLTVESIQGDFRVDKPAVYADPAEVGPVDCVLLCVKTWQLPEAARAMSPLLGADTFVVPLLNGVEASEQLAHTLGEKRVLGGIAKIISYRKRPGMISHTGANPAIDVGELNKPTSERSANLVEEFELADIRARVSEDIRLALWEKFLFVASWGGVGAVCRVPIGVLRAISDTRRMLELAMEEIVQVAAAHQVQLSDDVVSRTLGFLETLPPDATTSLQRDITQGERSELDDWNGAVVRLARETGIATPTNSFIYNSLLPQELHARGAI